MESVGVRGGFQSDKSNRAFNQVEAFGNLNMPWGWDLGRGWHLQSRLDLSASWLGGRGDSSFIGTLGPSLALSQGRLPLSLDVGISPTILNNEHFGAEDFGMPLQFTSYLGLNWNFAAHWRLGYRIQHMSNGGLATPNPGLNMHMFALSYIF
jgi:hypothetical protein